VMLMLCSVDGRAGRYVSNLQPPAVLTYFSGNRPQYVNKAGLHGTWHVHGAHALAQKLCERDLMHVSAAMWPNSTMISNVLELSTSGHMCPGA
jgi:hypothetical protein